MKLDTQGSNEGDSPENTVAGLVSLPGAQNGNVTGQRSLHEELLALEFSDLSLLARLEYLARRVQANGDSTILDKGSFRVLALRRFPITTRLIKDGEY